MAELVYAHDSKSCLARDVGSTPTLGTMEKFPVIIALDGMDKERALSIAEQLSGRVWGFKVHALVDQYGPDIITLLKPFGKVFVDVKLHDIPNTVAERTAALIENGADLITVHASAGTETLRAAVEHGGNAVVAVTKLTSEHATIAEVVALAEIAYAAGVRNIVCSAHEAAAVRKVAPDATIITPGIRAKGGLTHDQKRVATPQEALSAGANLLVVGRAITESKNPELALERLFYEKD